MTRSIPDILAERVLAALHSALGADAPDALPAIQPCNDPQFGDYQFNGVLPLAKPLKKNPRALASAIVAALEVADICAPPEVAGPGFINFRLTNDFLARTLAATPPRDPDAAFDRLGIAPVAAPQKVVVDMSSPNLAKEMHVGHLRSTVIGESVARILEFAGHTVERVNHVGDWGTQFGMLVAHLRSVKPDVLDDPEHLALGDLESFYVEAKRHFDADPAFADAARQTVVALQGGDGETLRIWRAFCAESLRHCHVIYDMLGITKLTDRGESFYNDKLAGVVEELAAKGMIEKSEGADCVFLDGFTARDGSRLPMMVRKSDGGYLYATTDLAALRYRICDCGAQRVIYVVGAPQKQHFAMLFAAAQQAGWADASVTLEHLAFGSMLGADSRPFRTREGGTVKLKDLLAEAVSRARAVVEANVAERTAGRDTSTSLAPDEIERIARTVGIGAVRYFDLTHALGSDYKFEWDTMLALDGNTAPYMLYAYARVRSIGRKAGIDFAALAPDTPIVIEHDAEIALAKTLLRFPEIVAQLVGDLRPNVLTEYLFELSRQFSRFYDRKLGVRVIDAEPESLRRSRLRLCDLTARVIRTGLHLLGLETLEQM